MLLDPKMSCGNVGCTNHGKDMCSQCGGETYCSKACQKQAWPSHKLTCSLSTKPEACSLTNSFDDLSSKQLKNLILRKIASYPETKRKEVLNQLEGVEKSELLKIAQNHVLPNEIESLLSSKEPIQAATKKKRAQHIAGSNGMAANNYQMPTASQLKERARMIRKVLLYIYNTLYII